MPAKPRVIVLMGVSGAGKSTVGKLLATRLGWQFKDADDFHSAENKTKMQSGRPLSDGDRLPWLQSLAAEIALAVRGAPLVLACSALKEEYRQLLESGLDEDEKTLLAFIHLKGDFQLIAARLEQRPDHFMNKNLLASQFETLEEPRQALTLEAGQSPTALTDEIINLLQLVCPALLPLICAISLILSGPAMPTALAQKQNRIQKQDQIQKQNQKQNGTSERRLLEFPTQISIGKIYLYQNQNEHLIGSGPLFCEARGKVAIPANQRAYLIPSERAIEQPELLDKIAADSFYGFSFGRKANIMSVEKVIPHLAHLTGLKQLILENCDLTDDQLKVLKPLVNMESLNISGNNLQGSCLKDLSSMKNMINLDLTFTPLKPVAFENLALFDSVKSLSIARSGVTDSTIGCFAKMKNLHSLNLSGSHISAQGLAKLKDAPALKLLNISACSLKNNDVQALQGSNLTYIILPTRPKLRLELISLKKALPKCIFDSIDRSPDSEQIKDFAPLH